MLVFFFYLLYYHIISCFPLTHMKLVCTLVFTCSFIYSSCFLFVHSIFKSLLIFQCCSSWHYKCQRLEDRRYVVNAAVVLCNLNLPAFGGVIYNCKYDCTYHEFRSSQKCNFSINVLNFFYFAHSGVNNYRPPFRINCTAWIKRRNQKHSDCQWKDNR